MSYLLRKLSFRLHCFLGKLEFFFLFSEGRWVHLSVAKTLLFTASKVRLLELLFKNNCIRKISSDWSNHFEKTHEFCEPPQCHPNTHFVQLQFLICFEDTEADYRSSITTLENWRGSFWNSNQKTKPVAFAI